MIPFSFLDSSWECPSCHSQNPNNTYVCSSCHTLRPLFHGEEGEQLREIILNRNKRHLHPSHRVPTQRVVKPFYIAALNMVYPGLGLAYAGLYMSAIIYFLIGSAIFYVTYHSFLFLVPGVSYLVVISMTLQGIFYLLLYMIFSAYGTIRVFRDKDESLIRDPAIDNGPGKRTSLAGHYLYDNKV